MTSAYCPAHITCFFRPVPSDNILQKGSRGVGIRLASGTTLHMDEIRGKTKVTINGKEEGARITKYVLEHMAPGRSFDVNVESVLPSAQGFGMSASGAVAAALCVSEITGKSIKEAFEAAHTADAVCGGGLGDVAGLMHEGDVPVRVKAGMPPFGNVIDHGISFKKLTMIVLGQKLHTAGVLGNNDKVQRICHAGDAAMESYLGNASKDSLFKISDTFSADADIRGPKVSEAMLKLKENGTRSSMCMLGNSIFTDAAEEEIRCIIGENVRIFSSSSTGAPARIIRKA
jgi:pantoate kinase